ncbi:prephenate dehydrogenase [Bacillus songklensis]|uniref:Prephenate dehydrogenase n=1 Tax=Bacillus songklensis TaxID=1069116 RepID=A0ABV8B1N1_9BACI
MKKRVLLIGTGLIGGSIALAIKKEADAIVVGYDINKEQVNKAKQRKVIDEVASSLQEEAELAHLIILASPVEATTKLMRRLAAFHLREDVIITDAGSTKGDIMALANDLWQGEVTFIGGHPMAGSHKAGVESAKAHLFENAFYVLTPHSSTSFEKIEELKQWLKGTNSHFLVLDTEEHDYITGVISHFPHIIAAGLVKQAKKHADKNPLISLLAAGGFRDITRIASSSPNMWKDIVKQNRHNILHLLEDWMMEMQNIQHILMSEDDQALTRFFEDSKDYRDALPVHSKGAIPSYYDLYVDVMDVPGAIARITSLLAEQEISITNLHIIESREGLLGVLRISFQTDEDRSQAQILLQNNEYKTYEAA